MCDLAICFVFFIIIPNGGNGEIRDSQTVESSEECRSLRDAWMRKLSDDEYDVDVMGRTQASCIKTISA